MKIIVLGGAGDMASRAVEDLVSTEGVNLVTIADRNVEAAGEIAAGLSGRGAEVDVKEIDANDRKSLVSAMKGYDVAASGLGPFHQYEERLVRAAIDAGVDYASICDEWEAAQAVIEKYGEDARKRDVTIVTGLGVSPGISNIGIRLLAQDMDKVRRADVSVYQPLNAGGGEAVVRHMLFIMSGDVATWKGGKRVKVKALSESRIDEFPRYGKVRTWRMGHSEPETVPRFIPGVEEVNFFMGFGSGAEFFVYPAKWNFFATKGRMDMVMPFILLLERLTAGEEPDWGSIRIDVWGEKKGEDVHGMICGIGQMREFTGLSLSVGAVMLAKKQILTEEGGVYAPEGCIEPGTFLDLLKTKGLEAFTDIEMKEPL